MLYGAVADAPRIIKDETTGEMKRAAFHIAVVKDDRNTGLEDKHDVQLNYPLVITQDPEQMSAISKLKINDIVELDGVFTTRKIKKMSHCKYCGHKNVVDGNICYVRPISSIQKRNQGDYTQKQAIQEVIKNKAFSDRIYILGNLCTSVHYYENNNHKSALYQIGSDRKFFIQEDNPDNRSDYPIINTYGMQAKKDELALRKGSLVYVDGYLHSKEFMRKTKCTSEACGKEYQWKDDIIDIIAYDVQYCANYTDPEVAQAQRDKAQAEERTKTTEGFFGHKLDKETSSGE